MSTMNSSGNRTRRVALPSGQRRTPLAAPPRVILERIRSRAYEIYKARIRNGISGDATWDWLQAESELMGFEPESRPVDEMEMRSQTHGEAVLSTGK